MILSYVEETVTLDTTKASRPLFIGLASFVIFFQCRRLIGHFSLKMMSTDLLFMKWLVCHICTMITMFAFIGFSVTMFVAIWLETAVDQLVL